MKIIFNELDKVFIVVNKTEDYFQRLQSHSAVNLNLFIVTSPHLITPSIRTPPLISFPH